MNLSKISDDFSAMVQKCKQGATKASDSIEAMATSCKKNIATAVNEKITEATEKGRNVSGFWKKMDTKAKSYLSELKYQEWKQKIDDLFPKIKRLCTQLDLEEQWRPCFAGPDRYDDYVRIGRSGNETFYYFGDLYSAIGGKSKEAQELLAELKKIDQAGGLSFASLSPKSREEMQKAFSEAFKE